MNVTEVHPGYRGSVSPEEQAKAKKFFDYGKTVADTGNFDYAINLFLQGLAIDPDLKEAHQSLRDISLKRKGSGGKDLGMFEKAGLKKGTKDDKQAMLNAEKLLAFDPSNLDNMLALVLAAARANFMDTALWAGAILSKANAENPKGPDKSKYVALKDAYKGIGRYDLAVDACNAALALDHLNMDLQREAKDLGALNTMKKGAYEDGDFRKSVRSWDKQNELNALDRDVTSEDTLNRKVREAEAEWQADPVDGKLLKYVEALEHSETVENENRAIEVLEEAFGRTKQFRFRQRVGKIQMSQMSRQEKAIRTQLQANPDDPQAKSDYEHFKRDQLEFELREYKLWSENYPTDLVLRYQYGARLFALKRTDEAIPILQEARRDPKLKYKASLDLGRAFLDSGFVDEATETLQEIIDAYQLKGDDLSKQMYYWQGRAFEQQGNSEQALKRFSQVAQWEFTYRDVQQRIRALRAKRE